MGLAAFSLITMEEASEQGLDLDLPTLETLIDAASELALERLGPFLWEDDIVEFPDLVDRGDSWANLGQMLRLRRRPISAVALVKVDNEEQTVKSVEEATELPITREPKTVWTRPEWLASGKVFRATGWPKGAVMVKYSAGYKGPHQEGVADGGSEIPRSVRQAVLMIMGNLNSLIERGMDMTLISERTPGSWSQKWKDDKGEEFELIPHAAAKLLVYHKRRFLL